MTISAIFDTFLSFRRPLYTEREVFYHKVAKEMNLNKRRIYYLKSKVSVKMNN